MSEERTTNLYRMNKGGFDHPSWNASPVDRFATAGSNQFSSANGAVVFRWFFPLAVAVLALLNRPVFQLPYYWDEAGSFIPAARQFGDAAGVWVSSGPLMPLALAMLWKIFGEHVWVTRMLALALGGGVLYYTFQIGRKLWDVRVAACAALWLAITPLFLAESGLYHPQIALTFLGLWALHAFLERSWVTYAIAASAMVLVSHTGLVFLLGLCLTVLFSEERKRASTLAIVAAPAALLAAWAFLTSLNQIPIQQAAVSPMGSWGLLRGAVNFLRYSYQLFISDFLFIPFLLTYWGLRQERQKYFVWDLLQFSESENTMRERAVRAFGALITLHLVYFSVAPGPFLVRSILPVLPVFLLWACAGALRELGQRPHLFVVLAPIVLAVNMGWTPVYPTLFENDLDYRSYVRVHSEASAVLAAERPGKTILTQWPVTDELSRPELGYVFHPLPVVDVLTTGPAFLRSFTASNSEIVVTFNERRDPAINLLHLPFVKSWSQRVYGTRDTEHIPAGLTGFERIRRFERDGFWVEVFEKKQQKEQFKIK